MTLLEILLLISVLLLIMGTTSYLVLMAINVVLMRFLYSSSKNNTIQALDLLYKPIIFFCALTIISGIGSAFYFVVQNRMMDMTMAIISIIIQIGFVIFFMQRYKLTMKQNKIIQILHVVVIIVFFIYFGAHSMDLYYHNNQSGTMLYYSLD